MLNGLRWTGDYTFNCLTLRLGFGCVFLRKREQARELLFLRVLHSLSVRGIIQIKVV